MLFLDFSWKLKFRKSFFKKFKSYLYPNYITKNIPIIFWSLFYGYMFSEKLFRILFNLPVNGQRTWTVSKTMGSYNNFVFFYKFYFFKKKLPKMTKQFFLAEYASLCIQCFNRRIWRKNRKFSLKKNYHRRFIDIKWLTRLKYIDLVFNRFAKVVGKKKKKHGYTRNLGFKFGFTLKYRNRLIK